MFITPAESPLLMRIRDFNQQHPYLIVVTAISSLLLTQRHVFIVGKNNHTKKVRSDYSILLMRMPILKSAVPPIG
jgi:hypothetical protein